MKKYIVYIVALVMSLVMSNEAYALGHPFYGKRKGPRGRVFNVDIDMYVKKDESGSPRARTDAEKMLVNAALTNFAYIVYEATDEQHAIGNIDIYEYADDAARRQCSFNIKWMGKLEDDAGVMGRTLLNTTEPGTINIGDEYVGAIINDNKIYSSLLNDSWRAGFVLAHEWGHGMYALGEEYIVKTIVKTDGSEVKLVQDGVKGSIMSSGGSIETDPSLPVWAMNLDNCFMYCNLSVPNSMDDIYKVNKETDQYKMWGQSCWEQLINPRPKSIDKPNSGARTPSFDEFEKKFDNLVTGGKSYHAPETDLNFSDTSALEHAVQFLKITWHDKPPVNVIQCVSDHSGSMSSSDMQNSRQQIGQLIETSPAGTAIGVIEFSSTSRTVLPITTITEENRASLKNQAMGLSSASGSTALWDASWTALDAIEAFRTQNHVGSASIVLMTDGEDNASTKTRSDIVARCKSDNVVFNTISYGNNTDQNALSSASRDTGGRHYSSRQDSASLGGAFQRTSAQMNARPILADFLCRSVGGKKLSRKFYVDSSLVEATVIIGISNASSSDTVRFISPHGLIYSGTKYSLGTGSSTIFRPDDDMYGEWTIEVTTANETIVSIHADAGRVSGQLGLSVSTDMSSRTVDACLMDGNTITNAYVSAVVPQNGGFLEVPMVEVSTGIYRLNVDDIGESVTNMGFTVVATLEAGVAAVNLSDGLLPGVEDGQMRVVAESQARVVLIDPSVLRQFYPDASYNVKSSGHDIAVDSDMDGTNDCIEVIMALSGKMAWTGEYLLSVMVADKRGYTTIVECDKANLAVDANGEAVMSFTLPVEKIVENGLSGPFEMSTFILWNESSGRHISIEGNYVTKGDYPISTWHTATTGFGKTALFVNAAREDDSGNGKSWRTAKKTVQGAIDCADTSATVFVYDGRYAPFSNSKSIFITSVNGADKVFVDGSLTWGDGVTNRCVTISNSGASIRGFTLENGIADCGGGLYLRGSAKDCVISNCVASSNGGGLYMYDGDCFATNCIVKDCIAASSGGGVFGPGLAINCLVTGNRAEKGGGLYGNKAYNCIISNNIADYGGGTYDGVMNNCTIVGNVGMITAGGSFGYTNIYYVAPHIGIIIVGSSSEPRPSGWFTNQCGKVCNSIVWGNSSPISNDLYNVEAVYSCASNCSMIDGNIRNDPMLYVCSDGRIMIRVNSPCIDTGVNSNIVTMLDYCGNGRVQNGIVDMGAIEWQGYKSVNGNFVWQSGGDGAWDIDYDQDVAAQGCFVSGDISHSQQTWIETTVKGCGTISFDWKVSSEARFDTLSIYVDGVRKKYISGITDWTSVTIPIEALATHTIRWVYAKSASGTSGEDRGWLDNVKWIPDVERNAMSLIVNSEFGNPSPSAGSNIFAWGDEVQLSVASSFELENVRGVCKGWSGTGSVPISGTETNLTFTIETPSSITWNWDLEYLIRVTATAYGIVDIESAWVKDKQCITITATPNESCGGFRWAGDVEGAAINGYAITIPANRAKNIKAEFLPPSYGVALGITGVELSSGGDSTWSIDYSESANGDGSSCRSGVIDGQGVSYIEMTVTGPGTLSFLWKLAVGFSVAGIDLVIDGDIVDGLMDETDWIPRSFPVSSGTHTVRWEFYRDGSTPGDYACIDNVTWTGSVPTPGVAFKEVWIEGDTNWVAEVDSEERQYRLVGKTQTDYIYLLNADKWQMENWDCSGSASFEDYYSLSRDGLLSMKSCGCTGQGVLTATYGDMTAIATIKTSHSPSLLWTASPSSNLAYPGALIELSNNFVVKRSDGTTKETVGFDGLGKCLLHFKQDPIRSSSNAFGDNGPRIVDGHWLRIPKNVDYISSKTAFYMYVEASANGINESQFFVVPFAWYNSEPVTKTTETPVPYEWLIKHYYYAINTDPNVFESRARQQTGKRDGVGRLLTVADDYLAGTDPRDIESVFKTFISFKSGEPIVTWEPDLNENGTKEVRVYKTYGCKNLGGTWRDMTTVPEAEKGEFHFFKVTVEMPQVVEVPANVVASQGTSAYAVDLVWDAVDGATSYEIWRSVSESVTEAEKISTVQGETTYSDSNVIPTKVYYYWIRAVVGNGKMSDFDEPVSGRRKFETVQVIFDSNGGSPTITNNSFLVGSVYGTLPTPQRIGYDFSGWFTERNDGTGVTASTIARETITTLYAHWTPHSYTIHFDANGGDGSMEDQSMTYGTACKLSVNMYLREGWDFEGWAITAGSNEVVYNDAEEVINVVSMPNAVITLYAVWRISAPTNVSITKLRGLIWDGDGGYAEVRVSWDSVCDATSYEVWRSTSADVSTATRVSTTAGLSFDDALNSTYSSAVTFYFWIRAVNDSSTSKFSNRVSWYVEKKVHKW